MDTYSVLLVDDEVNNLNALERTLRHGYNIFSATNGMDALSILDENHIDLIIADHRMPGMTGIEFLEKAWQKYPDTIRIMLTAYTNQKLLMDSVNMVHAHGYLTKPWDPDEVISIVRKWQLSQAARKRLETEMLKTQELESVSVFANGIANDFDDILDDVLGNLYLAEIYVRSGETSGRTSQSLVEARKASLQGKDLAKQLLTFSRGGRPRKQLVSIPEIVRNSASFALQNSDTRCEFSMPDDLWFIEVDEGQMTPVICNLIINADHAMPHGGVIRVCAENLNIDEGTNLPLKPGIYAKISIIDHGVGIPDEHLQRIFNPYFTTKQNGSGLGLSTAYSIIKNHGGHIALESQVGVGTIFHIYLPASPNGIPKTKAEKQTETLVKKALAIHDHDD